MKEQLPHSKLLSHKFLTIRSSTAAFLEPSSAHNVSRMPCNISHVRLNLRNNWWSISHHSIYMTFEAKRWCILKMRRLLAKCLPTAEAARISRKATELNHTRPTLVVEAIIDLTLLASGLGNHSIETEIRTKIAQKESAKLRERGSHFCWWGGKKRERCEINKSRDQHHMIAM